MISIVTRKKTEQERPTSQQKMEHCYQICLRGEKMRWDFGEKNNRIWEEQHQRWWLQMNTISGSSSSLIRISEENQWSSVVSLESLPEKWLLFGLQMLVPLSLSPNSKEGLRQQRPREWIMSLSPSSLQEEGHPWQEVFMLLVKTNENLFWRILNRSLNQKSSVTNWINIQDMKRVFFSFSLDSNSLWKIEFTIEGEEWRGSQLTILSSNVHMQEIELVMVYSLYIIDTSWSL
jgi:hypothetical protein